MKHKFINVPGTLYMPFLLVNMVGKAMCINDQLMLTSDAARISSLSRNTAH